MALLTIVNILKLMMAMTMMMMLIMVMMMMMKRMMRMMRMMWMLLLMMIMMIMMMMMVMSRRRSRIEVWLSSYIILWGRIYFVITVTSQWARWRLKSPASPLFAQPFIQAQIKENIKAPRHWALCGEYSLHKWPITRKVFCIWWRHHVHALTFMLVWLISLSKRDSL